MALARKTPVGVPSGDVLKAQKERLRVWAEQQGWQAVEVQGRVYGGDSRAWQLGLSLWWSATEICELAEWVQRLSQ